MLGDTAARRRARRALGPWLFAAVALWLAFDNGPAFVDELRLRGSVDVGSETATVVSASGARPARAIRRVADDLFWGRGRRVTYGFTVPGGAETSGAAFVTHQAGGDFQPGSAVTVRYLATDPTVRRIDGEPGLILLSFRLLVAFGTAGLCVVLLRWRSAGRVVSPRVPA